MNSKVLTYKSCLLTKAQNKKATQTKKANFQESDLLLSSHNRITILQTLLKPRQNIAEETFAVIFELCLPDLLPVPHSCTPDLRHSICVSVRLASPVLL